MNASERFGSTHSDGDRQNESEIDVKELQGKEELSDYSVNYLVFCTHLEVAESTRDSVK